MTQTVIGIDPGLKGGIAIMKGDYVEAYRMPKTMAEQMCLAVMLKSMADGPVIVGIEKQWIQAGQGNVRSGSKSSTSAMKHYGGLLMLLECMGWDYIEVAPRTWQKKMLPEGEGNTKEKSLALAREHYPEVDLRYKCDDGKSDALLICEYVRNKYDN